MYLKITGKNKAIKQLEQAKNLIKEAEKILYGLPSEIGLEISEGEDEVIAVKDNQ